MSGADVVITPSPVLVQFGLPTPVAVAFDVREVVVPGTGSGPWPFVLRPAVMATFGGATALARFNGIPGSLGCIRMSFGFEFGDSTSLADLEARLRAIDPAPLQTLIARGAVLIIAIVKMPLWLSSSSDPTPVAGSGWRFYETAPAASLAAFGTAISSYASILANEKGLDGPSVLHEFWNEINASVFWSGTLTQAREHYEAAAVAARAVAPNLRFGGPVHAGPGTSIRDFILGLSPSTPLDFLSWHLFQSDPRFGWAIAENENRAWLAEAGRDPGLPQYITEFAHSSTLPVTDPTTDGPLGAVYYIAACAEMLREGIAGHTWSSISDANVATPPDVYRGGQGMFLHPVNIELPKASFNAVQLVAQLSAASVRDAVPSVSAAALGVGAFAGVVGSDLLILVFRRRRELVDAWLEYLRIYRPLTQITFDAYMQAWGFVDVTQALSYLARVIELPGGIVEPDASRLAQGRTVVEAAAALVDPTPVRIRTELSVSDSAQVYRIRSDRHNPKGAYESTLIGGGTLEQAVNAAQAASVLAPEVLALTDGAAELPLEAHEVLLIRVALESAAPDPAPVPGVGAGWPVRKRSRRQVLYRQEPRPLFPPPEPAPKAERAPDPREAERAQRAAQEFADRVARVQAQAEARARIERLERRRREEEELLLLLDVL